MSEKRLRLGVDKAHAFMLITCPSCSSAFTIDAERVGTDGRTVRCGACREPWFISPAEVLAAQAEELGAAPAQEPDAAPAVKAGTMDPELDAWLNPPPEPDPSEGGVVENVPPPPPRSAKPGASGKPGGTRASKAKPSARRGLAGLSPATAAGLAILAAVPLVCLARVTVVRALPQTAGLYARIGLPVNLRGLELRDVVAFRNPADAGRPAELVIEGDLVGVARGDSPVPTIEAELRDAAGNAVKTYPIPAPRSVLGQAETARFRAHFPDPPAGGRIVELRFADARDTAPPDITVAPAEKAAAGAHAEPDPKLPAEAPASASSHALGPGH